MKKLWILAVVATMFAACSQYEETAFVGSRPAILSVGFEEESRVQLVNGNTVWNEGDRLSVFYKTTANELWKFDGTTGDKKGTISKVGGSASSSAIDKIVAVYPYDESTTISTNGQISVNIPTTQTYTEKSYGVGANIMVGKGNDTELSMKSVCGWLKVQFTGDATLKTIKLKGNNNEKLAGSVTIDSETLAVVFNGDATSELTINCNNIQLSETPTEFYFAIAPQTFEGGISIVAECTDGKVIDKSTTKSLTITRNHILPMTTIGNASHIPNNEIWYTSTDGKVITPSATNVFGAQIISNTYKNGVGKIVFDNDVRRIGDLAFNGMFNASTNEYGATDAARLTSITMPNSVTEIGIGAFSLCEKLVNINISDNVISIGNQAFESCSALESFIIPKGVTKIEDSLFNNCINLKNITIPTGVTSIGTWAFSRCEALKNIVIPNSVTQIKDYAFLGCRGMETITLSNTITSIKSWTFSDCNSLKQITIPNNVTTIEDYAFFCCSNLTNVTIPNKVTSIAEGAFSGCENLTSVTIGSSVTSIGKAAFQSCTKLTNISMPTSITSLGDYAFAYCYSLTTIGIPNSVVSIGERAFYECKSLTSITIPDRTTSIGSHAFQLCTGLTYAKIGNGVTSIGEYTFSSCSALEQILVGDNVALIGNRAFYECSSLTYFSGGINITSIGESAFWGCSSLRSFYFHRNVTSIGESAFYKCSKITQFFCSPTTPPTLGNNAFLSVASSGGLKIYVPTASVDAYKSATNWSKYSSVITGYNF